MTLKCFKAKINDQLVDLLKKICAIDLSKEKYPFVTDGGSVFPNITLNYRFKYGRVSISANDHDLTVIFFFDYEYREKLKIPFYSNNCIVNVDNNLNLIKATFNDYIALSSENSSENFEPACNEHHSFNIMLIHTVEFSKTYNSLFYNIDEFDDYLDITDDVDNRFYINNFEFELLLVKFIRFAAYDPTVFYSCFSKYPSYNELITDKAAIVSFVNLFIEQYFNDHDNLIYAIEQHLLLVDMQYI
jgi:hypothetical protein